MGNDFIEDLKRQIEQERIELKVKEDLLAKWTQSKQFDRLENAQPLTASFNEVIDVHSLIKDKPKRNSLIDDVQKVVKRFGDQEFTVAHVDKVLKSTGVLAQDDMHNRARISTVLTRLKDSGELEITFKGGGNVPNKYVVKHKENDDET